jgi:CRISPR-associated protein Csx14
VHELIRSLKQRQCTVHFSITGGRRLVSFLSISAVLSSFDHADRIWHIYTPEAVQQRVRGGKNMHALPGDGIRLIEVPFARLSQSLLPRLIDTRTYVREPSNAQKALPKSGEYERCKQVEQNLTRRASDVLQSFAQGRSPQEVAEQLSITPNTVSTYTTKILDECRTAWSMPDDQPLRHYFLREKFKKYFGFE